MMNNELINKVNESIERLEKNENVIYFLTYDSKDKPMASIKHIYDIAYILQQNKFNVRILVEDKSYTGVSNWLGDKYKDLEVVSIKENTKQINPEDVLVVPELYSNALEQLSKLKCIKVMLIQQKEYIFETLPIGSKWLSFGFDNVITTTQSAQNYIQQYFPESLIYIIPPIIDDIFSPSTSPLKPFISILTRERIKSRKIISEFYLKYPQLRWITFKDMVNLSYEDFASNLKECMVSVWIDDESTFGTFPLESMKCKVPVVGKIPNTEPDWLSENGIWTYDENKIVDLLAKYVLSYLEGIELDDEVYSKMNESTLRYQTKVTESNVLSTFKAFSAVRLIKFRKLLENENKEEEQK